MAAILSGPQCVKTIVEVNMGMSNYMPEFYVDVIYCSCLELTHWGREKMAAISETTFWNAFFNENVQISIEISLRFVPKGPINNIPALVQIMAWRRPGDKPLS